MHCGIHYIARTEMSNFSQNSPIQSNETSKHMLHVCTSNALIECLSKEGIRKPTSGRVQTVRAIHL